MPTLTSFPMQAEFLLSEAPGQLSRENITVDQSGAAIPSGSILTKIDTGAATAAATAGNTGNPTFGAITAAAASVKLGAHTLTFTAATTFDVEDPDGVQIGSGDTGVAFSKSGLGFTLTAGSTAAVAGDEFKITVAAGTGHYIAYTAGGAAGSADAVLMRHLHAATGSVKAVGFVRLCELNRYALTGLDATAEAQLATKFMIVRGAV